jgi:PAS domain S-box-containing protein
MKNFAFSDFSGDILVVDDEAVNLILLKKYLSAAGFKVRTADSGEDALELTSIKKPSLILLDILMPGQSGFEVCEILKNNPNTKNIPVVFVSAVTDFSNIVKGLKLGAVDYITKPFHREEILGRVTSILNLVEIQNKLETRNEELRKQQEILQESEGYLKAIFNNNSAAIVIIESDNTISMVNNVFCKVSGFRREMIIGQSWKEFIPESESERLEKIIRIRLQNRYTTPDKHEFRYLHKSGEIKHGLLSAVMIPQTRKLIASFQDITELKLYEFELKKKHETLYSIINSTSKLIIFSLDKNYCYRAFNEAHRQRMKNTLGADIVIGINMPSLLDSENEKKEFIETCDRVFRGEYISKVNKFPVSGKDYEYFEELWNPIISDKGKTVGISVVMKDITNLKISEKALIKSKNLLDETQQLGKIGSWEYNIGEDIFTWSLNMYRICNIEPEDTGHLSLEYFSGRCVHPDDRTKFAEAFENCINNNENIDLVFRINADNSVKYLYSQGEISNNGKNDELKIIGFSVDRTNEIKLERQRSLSQKMESVGQLAAGIAHEINTPMQFVGDNATFIDDGFKSFFEYVKKLKELSIDNTSDPEQKEEVIEKISELDKQYDFEFLVSEIPAAIESAQKGVERVSKIVRAMKTFSHPSLNKKSATDINHAIEVTALISKNEWKYVSELEILPDEDLPQVNCSIDEINQVILNLIINAAQAIEERLGGESTDKGKIIIRTGRDGEFAEIIISDTGIGIPEDKIHRIWEPFYTTKDVGKGTGQGLAIAHDIIVNKHKGEIHVESKPGEGTEFVIRLPFA